VIADDDEIAIAIHKIYLKKSGLSLNPSSFINGKEALDYVSQSEDNNTIYLVFLDINMPVLNGWEFMDEIKNKPMENRVHIVLVTSSINKIDKEKAKNYTNTIDYLLKPITLEDCLRIKSLPVISVCFEN
jgi:CheY-like chemotaxis protein